MKAVNFLFFLVFLAIFEAVAFLAYTYADPSLGFLGGPLAFILAWLLAGAIKIVDEWEQIIILRFGKFSTVKKAGIRMVIPVIDRAIFVDTRVLTMDIPKQQAITKDNVPVLINGVVYFKVVSPQDAITKVQSYSFAMSQYAQATLRDVIGGMTLDQLLAERDQISREIEQAVQKETESWGLEVSNIKIQDIDMPEDLKKMMSRQASAEREKRATITKAEGDKEAAFNLAAAAMTMAASPGAMQLRTLQTLDGLGPTASNTVVMALPIDIMEGIRAFKNRPPTN